MRQLCNSVVEIIGSWWILIGWMLFFCVLIIPFVMHSNQDFFVWLTILGLLSIWWIIDLIDQEVAFWKVLVGLAMLVIGCLPKGSFLIVACWVIYCMRVRE